MGRRHRYCSIFCSGELGGLRDGRLPYDAAAKHASSIVVLRLTDLIGHFSQAARQGHRHTSTLHLGKVEVETEY